MPTPIATGVSNDHNVYVLGAGFSADAGLPLMDGFLDKMRDARVAITNTDDQDAIDAVFAFSRSSASSVDRIAIDPENIEDLFSLAELAGDDNVRGAVPVAIAATLDHCRQVHQPQDLRVRLISEAQCHTGWTFPPPSSYPGDTRELSIDRYQIYIATIAGLLGERRGDARDTVITFNYDDVIERAAQPLGVTIDYGIPIARHTGVSPPVDPREPTLTVLKLHGSINWAASSQDAVKSYPDYSLLREHKERPFLIPPTWNKTLAPTIGLAWKAAVQALSTATRIAVIGYSMPSTDTHFKYLMAAGLMHNVSLRQLNFVGYGQPGAIVAATNALKNAAGTILRRSSWGDRRIEYTVAGTASFFLQTLPLPQWGRNYRNAISCNESLIIGPPDLEAV